MTKNLSDSVKRRMQPGHSTGDVESAANFMMGGAVAPLDIARPIADLLLREIDLDRIKLDPSQPRKSYSEEGLADLAESIKEQGLLQAIGVFWSDSDNAYLILYGERRFRASGIAGKTTVPAVIWPSRPADAELAFKRIVENEQREALPPFEAATALSEVMEREGLSQRQVAKQLGKSPMYVNELLSILKITPEILQKAKGLPKSALIQIARAKDQQEQERLFKAAIASDRPHTVLKQERAPRERPERFVQRFALEDHAATVTVMIQRPEALVSRADIEAALERALVEVRKEG